MGSRSSPFAASLPTLAARLLAYPLLTELLQELEQLSALPWVAL
jgi:hypothetical protein